MNCSCVAFKYSSVEMEQGGAVKRLVSQRFQGYELELCIDSVTALRTGRGDYWGGLERANKQVDEHNWVPVRTMALVQVSPSCSASCILWYKVS